MTVPEHHKQIANHLKSIFNGSPEVSAYRDNNGRRPIPIGSFGNEKEKFFSAIGMCDEKFGLPKGRFEFSTFGSLKWLPNALTTSIYWLRGREFDAWPLVCEDVVKQNARSTYRHMLYVPSRMVLKLLNDLEIQWLIGIPIRDSEISLNLECLS
jgi:hypothetical protein